MATIGHSTHVTALHYQHATAERCKTTTESLDDVISAAEVAEASAWPADLLGSRRFHSAGRAGSMKCQKRRQPNSG
jgi:hypothetical protein